VLGWVQGSQFPQPVPFNGTPPPCPSSHGKSTPGAPPLCGLGTYLSSHLPLSSNYPRGPFASLGQRVSCSILHPFVPLSFPPPLGAPVLQWPAPRRPRLTEHGECSELSTEDGRSDGAFYSRRRGAASVAPRARFSRTAGLSFSSSSHPITSDRSLPVSFLLAPARWSSDPETRSNRLASGC